MGRNHFPYEGTQVVAICDVDKRHIAQALPMLDKGVKTFGDYREMIKLPEVDIVHIATPPHWHGIMAVDADNAGKMPKVQAQRRTPNQSEFRKFISLHQLKQISF